MHSTYIHMLKEEVILQIKEKLREVLYAQGLRGKTLNDAIEDGLNGRLEDLEDTFPVAEFMKNVKISN